MAAEQTALVETEVLIPLTAGEKKILTWRSRGAQLKVSQPQGDATFDVFVYDRVDTPFVLSEDVKKPVAVRVIPTAAPDRVTDYVFYPDDSSENITVAEYNSPREIIDTNEYYRGEWPIPEAYLTDKGAEKVFALAETALSEPGTIGEVGDGVQIQYEQLKQLDTTSAGTPPLYPVLLVE